MLSDKLTMLTLLFYALQESAQWSLLGAYVQLIDIAIFPRMFLIIFIVTCLVFQEMFFDSEKMLNWRIASVDHTGRHPCLDRSYLYTIDLSNVICILC